VSGWASGLYRGSVTHRRLRPRVHFLRHRLFQWLLDLDELDALDRRLKLFSRGRFNLFSFRDGDHGDGSGDLRGWCERLCGEAGVDIAGGAVRLLSIPRVLGHVFNPISLFFCHDAAGRLACLIHQVDNTFGERHSYVVPVDDPDAAVVRQVCAKRFHVSPFMDLDMTYHFAVAPPAERVSVRIDGSDAEGPVIAAVFAGERRDLTDRTLVAAFLGHPLQTLMVVAGIHWGALRLWLKGVRYRAKPPAPAEGATVVRADPVRRAA